MEKKSCFLLCKTTYMMKTEAVEVVQTESLDAAVMFFGGKKGKPFDAGEVELLDHPKTLRESLARANFFIKEVPSAEVESLARNGTVVAALWLDSDIDEIATFTVKPGMNEDLRERISFMTGQSDRCSSIGADVFEILPDQIKIRHCCSGCLEMLLNQIKTAIIQG